MNEQSTDITVQNPELVAARFREATNIAGLCKEIVLKTRKKIGGRQFVPVEGWTAIAVAHGCIGTIKEGSVREAFRDGTLIGIEATAELVRQSDGKVLSSAPGFVGMDEPVWFGGPDVIWENGEEKNIVRKKRADYAIRAMACTRGLSRVCRTSFSHVVVLMNEGLETTPYEEMAPTEDPDPLAERRADEDKKRNEKRAEPVTESKVEVPRDEITKLEKQFEDGKWEQVKIHFGKNSGIKLVDLEDASLLWYAFTWDNGAKSPKGPSQDDKILRAACNVAIRERALTAPKPRD